MTTPMEEIGDLVFRLGTNVKLSAYAKDIKTFNVILALDGKRSVKTISQEDLYDPEELAAKVKTLYDQGVIMQVGYETASTQGMTMRSGGETASRGQAKKILDAIIEKRSRGIGAIAKTIKIKMALKGINPDLLKSDTPDDPVMLNKLSKLARSYGLQISVKSNHSKGRIKLILDSIITQRSGGSPTVAKMIKTKLMLKGINTDAYSLESTDDPGLVRKLTDLAMKLGVRIPTAAESAVGDQIEQFF